MLKNQEEVYFLKMLHGGFFYDLLLVFPSGSDTYYRLPTSVSLHSVQVGTFWPCEEAWN